MVKYNNMAYRMGLGVLIANTLFPIIVIHFATQKPSLDTLVPAIGFIIVIISVDFLYFYLLHQWYFTSYDEQKVVQKWFKKRKEIYFKDVKFLYFVDDLVILTNRKFNLSIEKSHKKRNRVKRTLKNEVCININIYDKVFSKMLLSKCVNAEKVDLGMEMEAYRKLFELD